MNTPTKVFIVINLLMSLGFAYILMMWYAIGENYKRRWDQDTKALGRMAFVVIKTFLKRLENLGLIALKKDIYDQMIQYQLVKNDITPDVMKMAGIERPPIVSIPEYLDKFGRSSENSA